MSWNYRVIRHEDKNGDKWLAIHEVFYDSNHNITSWTTTPVYPVGDTLPEFRESLRLYEGAIARAVLNEKQLIAAIAKAKAQ